MDFITTSLHIFGENYNVLTDAQVQTVYGTGVLHALVGVAAILIVVGLIKKFVKWIKK